VDRLVHRRKRSHGTGALHADFGESLSRRDIDTAVREARREYQDLERAAIRRLQWHYPGLVWAIDDTCFAGRSGYIHTVRDLASRYMLDPLAGNLANGEQVAAHIDVLFAQNKGGPLFLKRDNGSNLNDNAVNEVLDKWAVIPLNSPVRRPQYNGAVENAQKDWDRVLDPEDPKVRENLQLHGILAAHKLNHIPRQILGNLTPCAVFHGSPRRFSKRQRIEAHEWITENALELTANGDQHPACAWRTAVLTWLQMNNLITIHLSNVSPRFPTKCAHN
jgi:hypothetical protein